MNQSEETNQVWGHKLMDNNKEDNISNIKYFKDQIFPTSNNETHAFRQS